MNYKTYFPDRVQETLDRMEAEEQRVNQATDDHWVRARSLKPDSAALLYLLACSAGAQRMLEIGTSVGYSTIHLALATAQTGGELITMELLPAKFEQAQSNLERAGLLPHVRQLLGDARTLLDQAQENGMPPEWDLVFLDAEKDIYWESWTRVREKIRPGGLLIADNAISHAEDLQLFVEAVDADDRYERVTVPIGQGLEIIRRRKESGRD